MESKVYFAVVLFCIFILMILMIVIIKIIHWSKYKIEKSDRKPNFWIKLSLFALGFITSLLLSFTTLLIAYKLIGLIIVSMVFFIALYLILKTATYGIEEKWKKVIKGKIDEIVEFFLG